MADLRALTEQLYAALAAGDAETIDGLLHPDFVGIATEGLPLGIGGTYAGPQAMRDGVWWAIGKHFKAAPQPEEWQPLEDGRLLVLGTYRGSGRRSGRALEASYSHLISERDGKIASLTQLTDSAAWHDALGEILETWTYDVTDGVATACLDRPREHNAIDHRVASELLVIARRIQADRSVRAVLLCGEGPDLTVGGDLQHIAAHADAGGDIGDLLREMTVDWHEAFVVLSRLDAPVVTAAQGSVAGGGLGLVYAADITIAADDSRFVTAFAALGLSGDGGGTFHLPRRIGAARAAQAYLENRPISAADALAWGLVNELVPAADLREAALARATRLAQGPTRGYGAMRRLLRESWDRTLPDQLRAETLELSHTASTRDGSAAIAAFAARSKQRPTFEGA